MEKERGDITALQSLCDEFKKYNQIDQSLYERFDVKRGLRNQDGTGVVAGLTNISNVHGYIVNEGEKEAIPGELYYRGYNINDIVENCAKDNRFAFEEVVYLLLFGCLPSKKQLDLMYEVLYDNIALPDSFFEDMMLKAPSPNIMNKLSRSVLALYSYDESPEDTSLESEIGIALQLIAELPNLMVKAYQVKRRQYDGKTMYLHPEKRGLHISEEILSLLRSDRQYTDEEAKLLDLCMVLQAEHGGGNNSTFACRVLSSSGTDAYSAYAAAIGSLKGPLHGGANLKVLEMVENIKANVDDITNEGKVCDYLLKILKKEANDHSGKIYGMGHAVYTISDPRAIILKKHSLSLAKGTEIEADFELLNIIEKATPELLKKITGSEKSICANIDLYSGFVYRMLKIPADLFTPMFACSRIPGWSAHRIEELSTGNRIIRPAYKSIYKKREYLPMKDR